MRHAPDAPGLPVDPDGLPLVMGILNVTPDSFSDGGRWDAPDAAVAHAARMVAAGAHLVDVGGESTRPGSQRVDEAEELRRVVPVVRALADHVAVMEAGRIVERFALAELEAGTFTPATAIGAHLVADEIVLDRRRTPVGAGVTPGEEAHHG